MAAAESYTSPPNRPPHPLFGGGDDRKLALNDQIRAMGAKRAQKIENEGVKKTPEPSEKKESIDQASPSSEPSPSRPPHPLFGGGDLKLSLNDQIKATAAKRAQRIEKEGVKKTPEPPEKKKSIDQVMPPHVLGKPGGNTQTATLAEQVAMMAARREVRMVEGGSEPAVSDENEFTEIAPTQEPKTPQYTQRRLRRISPADEEKSPSKPVFAHNRLKPTGIQLVPVAATEPGVQPEQSTNTSVLRSPPSPKQTVVSRSTTTTTTTTGPKLVKRTDPECTRKSNALVLLRLDRVDFCLPILLLLLTGFLTC